MMKDSRYIDCPKCKGEGWFKLDGPQPKRAWGNGCRLMPCERCEGAGRVSEASS